MQTRCIKDNVRRTKNNISEECSARKVYLDDGGHSLPYRWAPEPKILDRLVTLQEMQRGTTEGLVELLAPGVTTGKASGVPEEIWLDPDGVAGACSVDGPGGSTVVIVWVGIADGEIVMTVVEGTVGVGGARAVTVTVMGFSFAVLVTVTMEGVAVAVVLTCEDCGASDAGDWACGAVDGAVSGEPCDG